LVEDFNSPVRVVIGKTVREADGLAMSSRNKYLSPRDRELAPMLYKALSFAQQLFANGERNATILRKAALEKLTHPELVVEYVSIASMRSAKEVDVVHAIDRNSISSLPRKEGAIISTAVKIGKTRLIDNLILEDVF
jgi:pantoate--beta-alanine ligase